MSAVTLILLVYDTFLERIMRTWIKKERLRQLLNLLGKHILLYLLLLVGETEETTRTGGKLMDQGHTGPNERYTSILVVDPFNKVHILQLESKNQMLFGSENLGLDVPLERRLFFRRVLIAKIMAEPYGDCHGYEWIHSPSQSQIRNAGRARNRESVRKS